MKRALFYVVAISIAVSAVQAQSPLSYEAGVQGTITKFESKTGLNTGISIGGSLSTYFLRRLALDLSGDVGPNNSSLSGSDLAVYQHRVDLIYNHPLSGKWRGMIGGGWTGSRFGGDVDDDEYDSGLNALIGLRYCTNADWSWTGALIGDFKDPSDQAPAFTRTQTFSVRVGLARAFGANRSRGPCVEDAPLPPPPPPARQPAPAAAPPAQPPAAQPRAQPPAQPPAAQPPAQPPRQEPPPQPAPRPVAPAPAPRPIMTFRGTQFDYDRAELKPSGRDTADVVVRFLNANPGSSVMITGHTDDRGADEYNMRLGQRRADAVRDYLVSKGISASRIQTASRGEAEPVTSNATAEGRAQNRRVDAVEIRP